MRAKCLGQVSYPHEIIIKTAVPRPDYGDNIAKNTPKHEPYYPGYLELNSKRYSNPQFFETRELYCQFIEESKKEPQSIYEISNKPKLSNAGRLFFYQEKIYECDQNYYNQQQVKLLILELLEKEKQRFDKLKQKYH